MQTNNDQLMPFAFGDNLVRVLRDENGEPWFVAKDVARALDYQWKGISSIKHVPEEWRVVQSVQTTFG
ncbi:MAG: Bro-N domain-containing protein, partial [Desulfovibrio sp.]|nr:Bro-N domain-containing protein [Desulfovibrio sp.]